MGSVWVSGKTRQCSLACVDELPWRGPGPGRPDLPIPPSPMPLRAHGALRKRWRYVGAYAPGLMLCAARAQVGPATQSFWAIWEEGREGLRDATGVLPGTHAVSFEGDTLAIDARMVKARLTLGESQPIETYCPSGDGWGWTRKSAGLAVTGHVEIDGRRVEVDCLGVDDQSAGYHRRHILWHWSAGVGRGADGSALAWNLVTGINDPPERSERAIWVDGVPREPRPVEFDDLDGIRFADGGEVAFAQRAERARNENLIVLRSRYAHRFGEFSGSLDGIELESGLGVMERHEALW